MDSAEIVYATVEEVIGKTGKCHPRCSDARAQPKQTNGLFLMCRLQRRYYTS